MSSCTLTNPAAIKGRRMCGLVAAAAGLSLSGCERINPRAKWRLGLSSPHETEILNEFYADMRREMQSLSGAELFIVDAADDVVKQLTDIEAFVAQRFDGTFFLVPSSEGLEGIVARGVSGGTYMFNHSPSPVTGCTQNVVLDQYSAGYKLGEYAARWIVTKHDGHSRVGLLTNRSDPELAERSRGLRDGVLKNAPAGVIAGEAEANTVMAGASGAANLLQAYPDIKALLAFADDPGYGAYTAALEAGRTQPEEFLVGSADGTQLVLDKISEGGIYQCCVSFLFPYSATQWMRDMLRCLRSEKVPPTRIMGSRVVTRDSLKEYLDIAGTPLALKNQKYHRDQSVMRYSDRRLTTPRS
jgi:ABC-type sugar transport system substrate-binding protein